MVRIVIICILVIIIFADSFIFARNYSIVTGSNREFERIIAKNKKELSSLENKMRELTDIQQSTQSRVDKLSIENNRLRENNRRLEEISRELRENNNRLEKIKLGIGNEITGIVGDVGSLGSELEFIDQILSELTK